MTYAEKLKDPRWQKRRLEIFQRDNFRCRICFATDKTLHVHHACYRPKVDPWEYEDFELRTLCESCHQTVGDLVHTIGILLPQCEIHFDAYSSLTQLLLQEDYEEADESEIATLLNVYRRFPVLRESIYNCAVDLMRKLALETEAKAKA